MKKWFALIPIAVMLCGCSATDNFETVDSPCFQEIAVNPKTILVDLPDEAVTPVLENGQNNKLYLCDGYSLSLQTLEGGNIDMTINSCTGFERKDLEVIETSFMGVNRYDCVWSAVGEEADQIARLAILDDGVYHYVLTVMSPAESAGKLSEEWNDLFASLSLCTDQ